MAIDYENLKTGEEILAAIESLKSEFKPEPFEKIIKTAIDGLNGELKVLKDSTATGSSVKSKKELTTGVKSAVKALDKSLKVIGKVSGAENADFSSADAKKTIKAAEAFLEKKEFLKDPILALKIQGYITLVLKDRIAKSKASKKFAKPSGKKLENLPQIIASLAGMLRASSPGTSNFNKQLLLRSLQDYQEKSLGLPGQAKLPVEAEGKKLEKKVSGWVTLIQTAVKENDPEISKVIKADGKNFVLA